LSQLAKRRNQGKDLPPGWQIWASFLPGGTSASKWLKVKLTGNEKAPDLSSITVGPPANSETIAAPGILLLHIEPDAWEQNLRRTKELLEFLPGDSPYLPGLLFVMIAHEKNSSFPNTWISKVCVTILSVPI
jgi:hypothetical protein